MFKNLKLAGKLGFGFGVLLLIFVFSSAFSIYQLSLVKNYDEEIINDRLPKLILGDRLMATMQSVAINMYELTFMDTPEKVEKQLAVMAEGSNSITEDFKILEQTVTTTKGKELLGRAQEERKAIRTIMLLHAMLPCPWRSLA